MNTHRKNYIISLLLLIFILCIQLSAVSSAEKILLVNLQQNTNDSYQSIQEAINNANHSDTILLSPGTYRENLIINKSITLKGQHKNKTLLQPTDTSYPAILIQNHNVHINNITIINASIAIYIVSNKNITNTVITNTILQNNTAGIFLGQQSHHSSIYKNTIFSTNGDGIYLYNSNHNKIYQNNISNQSNYGIVLSNSSQYNMIHTNTLTNNEQGIGLKRWSNTNNITNNILCNNTFAIHILHCFKNSIYSNIFCNNTYGLYLVDCSNNIISNNSLTYNYYGIYSLDSINNTITTDNIFSQNTYDNSQRSKTFQTPGFTLLYSITIFLLVFLIKKRFNHL
jgi:nitrous oxidase accessory protein